jgi:lactoylglutathione lyase
LPSRVDALMDRLDARLAEEGLFVTTSRVEHAAAWVSNLERACAFYGRWFGATAGPVYSSVKRPFQSCFLSLDNGARLELMSAPAESPRMAHIAISLGSREAVDRLIAEMRKAGVTIAGDPRITGDGHYEASVLDSEGNLVEMTVLKRAGGCRRVRVQIAKWNAIGLSIAAETNRIPMGRRTFLKNAAIAGGLLAVLPLSRSFRAMADDGFPLVDLHVHLTETFTIEQVMEISEKTGVQFGIMEHPGGAVSDDAGLKRFIDPLKPYPSLPRSAAD